MGELTQLNLQAFDNDVLARAEAAARRDELVRTLRSHIGRAVSVRGFPLAATFSTRLNEQTGKLNLVSGPVYSILEPLEEREPREIHDGALVDVFNDARMGHMVLVSTVNPDVLQERQRQPDMFQHYKFLLNQITELSLTEIPVVEV